MASDTASRPSATRDVAQLVTAQRAAFMARPPALRDRLDALAALERALFGRRHDIAATISEDFGGRAVEETLALEIFPLLAEIRHARRNLGRWMRPRGVGVQWQFWPGRAQVNYRPLGVVGVLSPWNYPFFLSLAPLAGALAAGNHVVLKPSELAPASADLMASILAGLFPQTYVAVVTGGPETAADLVAQPLDRLLFTGSTRVGKLVMKAASENLVPVTLELGGKSPAIVHPAYPVDTAATKILTGKLYNAGQTCVAPDYALVERGRAREFADAARAAISAMFPALVENPDYTRIVNARHYHRLRALVDDAVRQGAHAIEVNAAGDACTATNRVFPPTILTGVRDDMAVMQEEIFGPVLPIVEYATLDEAVAYVNARPHPLALYYFDRNRRRVDDVLRRVVAGGATVNDCMFHVGQTGLPFGGIGPSGMGRYHGFDGFETFSHKQGAFIQRQWSPLGLLRPPYGAAARSLLRFLLKT